MGASIKRLKSTLLPIEEHRQAKVCDSSGIKDIDRVDVAAGSLQRSGSRSRGGDSKVLRPLVKLKNAFVKLMASNGGPHAAASGPAAYFSMGVVMGPVDFGGYDAVHYYAACNNNYESR